MKKIVLSLLVLCNVCYADNLQPRFYTGNDLLSLCQAAVRYQNNPYGVTNQDALDGSTCAGYISGALDAEYDWLEINDPKAYNHLVNDLQGVTAGQLARIMVNNMEDNPQILNDSASMVIMYILFTQYDIPLKK